LALGGVEHSKRHVGIVAPIWFNGDGEEQDASRLRN
jgi:hypothetical protein